MIKIAQGGGKSTLLNVISGLDIPTLWEISYNDEIISNYGSKKLTKFRVVITHNPNIALMADRVIKMNSGRIEEIVRNEFKKNAFEINWS